MAVVARFVAVLILCLVILGISNLAQKLSEPQVIVQRESADFGPAPQFALINEHGAPFNSAELEGKLYVASFFFTSCRGPCPIINANIAKLHKQFSKYPGIRFVSISVDPETDTPDKLSDYSTKFKSDDDNSWTFLTGTTEQIVQLSEQGFHVALSGTPPIHTNRAALVSPASRILGFYDATDTDEMKRLAKEISSLLSEAPPS